MAAKTLQYFIRIKIFGEKKKLGFADVVLNMLNNSRAWSRVETRAGPRQKTKVI